MSTQKLKCIKKQQENYKQKQLNVGRVTTELILTIIVSNSIKVMIKKATCLIFYRLLLNVGPR